MIELRIQQGSEEWAAVRAKYFCASEAAAMMGTSPHMTRTELLRMKKTGIVTEVDDATQRRFDKGHAVEAFVRPIVEGMIDEQLYPIVATDDDGRLLASMDGVNMLCDTVWECKLLNQDLLDYICDHKDLPDSHWPQVEQQMYITGAEQCYFTVSDGTELGTHGVWYYSKSDRLARLLSGWDQFERDLAEFVPEIADTPAPIGRAPESLPALRIEITGMVTASNLEAFREHAMTVLNGINTNLQTDEDFADAEKTVKWAKGIEDRLTAAKDHALSQAASIYKLFTTIDAIFDEVTAVRLKLDKLVKSEKEARKLEIVTDAHTRLIEHVDQLDKMLGGRLIPLSLYGKQMFGEAIKGMKSTDKMRDKVSVVLAKAIIDTRSVADRIEENRKAVDDMSLVPDFSAICTKDPEDFAALVALRKQQRDAAEEEFKARRKARAAEQSRMNEERAPTLPAQSVPAPVDAGATITIGQLNYMLRPVTVDVGGLRWMGFDPADIESPDFQYYASDIPLICDALIRHINLVKTRNSA